MRDAVSTTEGGVASSALRGLLSVDSDPLSPAALARVLGWTVDDAVRLVEQVVELQTAVLPSVPKALLVRFLAARRRGPCVDDPSAEGESSRHAPE